MKGDLPVASYHFAIKTSENSKASANLHFDYICREGKYEYIAREGKFEQSPKAAELVYKEHGNLPLWAKTPNDFWQAAHIYEAGNRTSYREIELALPIELSQQRQVEIVQDFVYKHLGNDFVYSFAIHCNEARLSKTVEACFNEDGEIEAPKVPVQNPHVHIMFCERKLDGIERDAETFFKRANTKRPELGGANKDRRWNGSERSLHLKGLRESWANIQNQALKEAGFDVKVDHRSLKAQRNEALENGDLMRAHELDRLPEQHLGPKYAVMRNHPGVKNVVIARQYRQMMQSLNNEFFNTDKDKSSQKPADIEKTTIVEELPQKTYQYSIQDILSVVEEISDKNKLKLSKDFSHKYIHLYKPQIKQICDEFYSDQYQYSQEYHSLVDRKIAMSVLSCHDNTKMVVNDISNRLVSDSKDRLLQIDGLITLKEKDYLSAAKEVISPQRARIMALSVFTYGESKQLNKDLKKLRTKLATLTKEEQFINQKLKYNLTDHYRSMYNDRLSQIKSAKDDIEHAKLIVVGKQQLILDCVNKPTGKSKFKQICDSILAKNKPSKDHADNLLKEIETLTREKDNINRLIDTMALDNNASYNIVSEVQLRFESQYLDKENYIESLKDQRPINKNSKEDKEIVEKINLTISEMKDLCNKRLNELRKDSAPLRSALYKINRKLISPERAYKMAVNIYMKGANKKLSNKRNELRRLEANLIEREKLFASKALPKFYQLDYKKEYDLEMSKLSKWRIEIDKQKRSLEKQTEQFRQQIERPEVKTRLENIRDGILKKNLPVKIEVEKLKYLITNNKLQRSRILEFRKNIEPYVKTPKVTAAVSTKHGINIDDVLKQARNILSQLTDKSKGTNVGLSARLTDDDDDKKVNYHL